MIEHTNQMLSNGNTRCWDLTTNGYVMYEVKSSGRYRGADPNYCWTPGDPHDMLDGRGRPLKEGTKHGMRAMSGLVGETKG